MQQSCNRTATDLQQLCIYKLVQTCILMQGKFWHYSAFLGGAGNYLDRTFRSTSAICECVNPCRDTIKKRRVASLCLCWSSCCFSNGSASLDGVSRGCLPEALLQSSEPDAFNRAGGWQDVCRGQSSKRGSREELGLFWLGVCANWLLPRWRWGQKREKKRKKNPRKRGWDRDSSIRQRCWTWILWLEARHP